MESILIEATCSTSKRTCTTPGCCLTFLHTLSHIQVSYLLKTVSFIIIITQLHRITWIITIKSTDVSILIYHVFVIKFNGSLTVWIMIYLDCDFSLRAITLTRLPADVCIHPPNLRWARRIHHQQLAVWAGSLGNSDEKPENPQSTLIRHQIHHRHHW